MRQPERPLRGKAPAIRARVSRLAFRLAAADPRFVIVSLGRSGSELLVSLLDSHPGIQCDGEILHVPRPLPAEVVLPRSARAKLRGRAYGFKLLAHHLSLQNPSAPAAYLRSFHERGFRIILLERRRELEQAVSAIRAHGSQYNHTRKHAQGEFSPMRIDPVAVLAALYLMEDSARFLREAMANIPALNLVYEDDLEAEEQQQRTVDRVCAYLGIPPARVQTDLVKTAPRLASEQLENFSELTAVLSTTRFAGLIEDAGAGRRAAGRR